MKLNIAEPLRCIQFTVIIHIETPCLSFQVTIKSVHHSWPGILQSMPDLWSIVMQSAEFLGHVIILISWIKFMLVPLSSHLCPKVICSFLFRHWVSASTPPAAMKLLVAVVPYLGHNSAYVRGTAFFFCSFFWVGFSGSLEAVWSRTLERYRLLGILRVD